MNVEQYRPQAIVTFYTETGTHIARATNTINTPMDDDVIRIRTIRDMGADAPTFHIDLTRRQPWDKWVTSNDLVVIEMHRPPEAKTTVFFGLVDDCRKRVNMSEEDGSISRVITIMGRGLAKSLMSFDIGVVPEAEYSLTSVGWLMQAGINVNAQPTSEIIKSIWDVICKPHVNYKWDNGKQLVDYVKLNLSDRPNMKLLDTSTVMNWQGSIWAFIKEVAETPFYESFWEVEKGSPTLTVRPTPFNQAEWEQLPKYIIDDEDVVSEELGKSDTETYVIYSVGAKTLFSPHDTYKTFGTRPIWYEPYSDKFGNRRLHAETSYIAVTEGEDPTSQIDTMKSLMVDLFNWNIKNNIMVNGSLRVKGLAGYQVGSRLQYKSVEDGSEREYYVTSVSHDFMNYGRWTTELGLTRGIEPKDRFTEPWGKHTEYSGIGLLPIDWEAAKESLGLADLNDYTTGVDFVSSNKVVSGARDVMNNGINGVKVRYVFGGNSPLRGALDCSSFTQYIYQTYANLDIGRSTGVQVSKGVKVDKSNALPGDLVFFKGTYNSGHIYGVSHVGIYIGNNQFIHNSNSGVKMDELSNSYYQRHFLMFRRVLAYSQLTEGLEDGGGGGFDGDTSGATTSTSGMTKYVATAYGATHLNLGAPSWWVPTFKTATGTTPKEGRTIAADKTKIPLHSQVQIVCPSYPKVNGTYIVEDVGSAIKGNRIDIYFDDMPPKNPHVERKRMLEFGTRDIYVKVIRRGKG
jgi:3D (Asp-Asp-Asp) domain-containing protein